MEKSVDAYRTISEVAADLKLPQHVLRFWETRFPQIKPMKRGGGRRFYNPGDIELLRAIKVLLYGEGYTIKGVQRLLNEQGPRAVASLARSGQPRTMGSSRVSLEASMRVKPDPGQDHSTTAAGGFDADDELLFLGLDTPPAGTTHGAPLPEPRAPVISFAGPAENVPVTGMIEHLRAVLFDLAECERLLAAARA